MPPEPCVWSNTSDIYNSPPGVPVGWQSDVISVNVFPVLTQPFTVTVTAPVVAAAGTTALIMVFETTVNPEASVPLNLTDEVPVPVSKPVPVMVTTVLAGPVAGLMPETDDPAQAVVTVPLRVKSSNTNVPEPGELVALNTTVTVPVRLFTGLVTLMVPVEAPAGPGTLPLPTAVPFMDSDQFCAAEGVLLLQKLYEVILSWLPAATVKVSVAVVVFPLDVFMPMALPVAPERLSHVPLELDQEELFIAAFCVTGNAL